MICDKEKTNEISIAQTMEELLLRWKLILLAGIICMMVVVGYKYSKDLKASSGDMSSNTNVEYYENQSINIADNMTEDDIRQAELLVDRVKRLAELREYAADAAIMHIDPYNAKKMVVSFKDEGDYGIENEYAIEAAVNNDTFYQALTELLGYDKTDTHIADIITIDKNYMEEADGFEGVISISVYILDTWDADKLSKYMVEYILNYANGDKLRHLGTTVSTGYSGQVESQKNRVISIINTEPSAITSAVSLLDSDASDLFHSEIKALGLTTAGIKDYSELYVSFVSEEKGYLSYYKYSLVGFILGVILSIMLLTLKWTLFPKAGHVMGLGAFSNAPFLGIVHTKRRRNPFLYSPCIIKYRMQRQKEEGYNIHDIESALFYYASASGADSVSMVVVSKESDEIERVINLFIDSCESDCNIDLNKVLLSPNVFNQSVFYERLKTVKDVAVCIIEYDEINLKNVDAIYHILVEKGTKVIGTIGIE